MIANKLVLLSLCTTIGEVVQTKENKRKPDFSKQKTHKSRVLLPFEVLHLDPASATQIGTNVHHL